MESTPYTPLPSELVNFTTEPTPFDNISSSTLPIDMVFNDGHRVVIIYTHCSVIDRMGSNGCLDSWGCNVPSDGIFQDIWVVFV
ncbi:hypothetical protein HA402_004227 [Bradysia odoriphaga]|nr:hypothetical protein HA402_004227 [Bradysia odoriphaga]